MRVLPRGSDVFIGFKDMNDGVLWLNTKTELDIDLQKIVILSRGYNWQVLQIDENTRMQIDTKDIIDTDDIKE